MKFTIQGSADGLDARRLNFFYSSDLPGASLRSNLNRPENAVTKMKAAVFVEPGRQAQGGRSCREE